MESEALTGSCLCGGVRFEILGRPTPVQFCHARRCRKATGSAFAAEIACALDAFRWVSGEDLLAVYDAPLLEEPPAYRRTFCRVCGSPMPTVRDGFPWVVFQAGVLDDSPDVRPFRHVFVAERAGWFQGDDALPRFERRPPPEARLPATPDTNHTARRSER